MPREIRQRLGRYLRQQLTWREERLTRDPDDDREDRAVAALRAVLVHLDRLPPGDPRLALLEMMDPDGTLPVLPEQETSRLLAVIGDVGSVEPDRWLDEFVAAYARDWGGGFGRKTAGD